MANILDRVHMSTPVEPSTNPGPERHLPSIEEARKAVIDFLMALPDVRRADVTKLVVLDPENGTWEAEADVTVPNQAIRALGLQVTREVLDCRQHILRLDHELNITAYALRDSVVAKEQHA